MTITEEEKQRRQEACDYARASVELEGFVLPEEDEKIYTRYINGEITSEERGRLVRISCGIEEDFFDIGEIILNENTEELTQEAINELTESPQPPYGTPEWDRWKMARLARMASDPVYLERQMAFIRGARGYGRKHSI